MNESFMGFISMFGFNFAPLGWATCDGQLMSIANNTALFSLLGTTYGGDGMQTFALPDLRGRVPIHQGQSRTGTVYTIGEVSGEETVTLTQSQMPQHNHVMNANTAAGDTGAPTNAIFANTGATDKEYLSTGVANTVMSTSCISAAGGNQPHDNMQPFLVVNFCICLEGIYPQRN